MQLTDADFIKLRDYMYNNFGLNLAQKRTLIEGRLSNTLTQKGYKSFAEYIDYLMTSQSDTEVSFLVSKLTTNFTYFMRDEQHFEFLSKVILPEFVPRIRDGNLAIWSAGCSSGEEPYTLAMCLDDYFGARKNGLDTRVLATDISEKVLALAKNGVYEHGHISKIPKSWETKYFDKIGDDAYQVKQSIKKEVIFRKFNLMEPTFKFRRKFHVIFCRNVMIYFDADTRRNLARRFADSLMPGGYLIIGMSENLLNDNDLFTYVRPSIYRKSERRR
ncbi:MAG: CheR family methyltransferase [Christensenellaceae bacterium]|jgi:chemotaxis protein methyltransferase CheR